MSDTETQKAAFAPAPSRPGLLSRLGRHGYAILALVCLVLWLPGILSLPALDRDESRFAQSSRQMLESGNFIDIRFGQVPRYKKPVGIYWLQAATTAAAQAVGADSGHIWTYRLPSLLGGIAAVWLTFWCANALAGAEAAFLAGLLMATSVLLTAEATIATTDAVLLAAVLGVQGVLFRVYRAAMNPDAPRPPQWLVLVGWACMAVGILVKGPVAPAVAAVTVLALVVWDRQWRWLALLKPIRGVVLLLLLVLPWVVAIALQSHGAFFQQSLGNDFAAKLAGGQESHGALPGYFLALSALTFWPAILFIAPAIGFAVAHRAAPGLRFLVAWAGASWLMFEAVPTKLPHYVLPVYPALAILAALWLLAPRVPQTGWRRILVWIAALQFLAGLAAMVVAPVLLPRLYGMGAHGIAQDWPLLTASGVGALCGLAALIVFLRGQRLMALAPAFAAAIILVPTLTAGAGPRLTRLWVSERLAALVAKDSRPGDPPPVLAGYEEPSLVFALGADVGLTNGAGAADAGAHAGGLALIEDAQRPVFLARLAERDAGATAVDAVSGFNYSRGRPVHVTVYRVTPVRPDSSPGVR